MGKGTFDLAVHRWALPGALRTMFLIAPLITLATALPARALTYTDLILGTVSLDAGDTPVARLSLRILGLEVDSQSRMAELDLDLAIPMDAPREVELTLGMSEVQPKDAAPSGVQQRVRLGGKTQMGATISGQMKTIPNPKVVASVCESLLVSGFRVELLRQASARAPEGPLKDFWATDKAQQAILGLAGHCLYAATQQGIAPRNPLVRASLQNSPTQAAGLTSRDFGVSVKGLTFINHVNPKPGDDYSSTRVTLQSVTVEGQTPDAGGIYAFFWEGDLSYGTERAVYYSQSSNAPYAKLPGVVEGYVDLVLKKDDTPPNNASIILRQTATPYLLLLKHLLESEAAIRRSALQLAPISKKEAFAAFWTPLAGEVGRVPMIELLSEELAQRYRPDAETLMTVQKALAALGHYDAAIDGRLGAGTRAGIRAFEGGLGSKSDGYLTLWETALLAPTLLEPPGDGPAIEALRAELQAKKDAIRTDAELRLGIDLGAPETTEEAPLSFAMTARLKAQEARTNALKARLSEVQQQLRRRTSELTLRLTETGRDLAQCSCAGQLECLSTKVELP